MGVTKSLNCGHYYIYYYFIIIIAVYRLLHYDQHYYHRRIPLHEKFLYFFCRIKSSFEFQTVCFTKCGKLCRTRKNKTRRKFPAAKLSQLSPTYFKEKKRLIYKYNCYHDIPNPEGDSSQVFEIISCLEKSGDKPGVDVNVLSLGESARYKYAKLRKTHWHAKFCFRPFRSLKSCAD